MRIASWTSIFEPQIDIDFHRLEECFTLLEKYPLRQRQVTQTSYSIHRLVHAWGYDRLQGDGDKMKRFWHAASQFLEEYLEAIINRGSTPALKLRLVPHLIENIQSYRRTSKILGWDQFGSLGALESFGDFFGDIGRSHEARLAQKEVLKERQRILGDEHPGTISAMNNLANKLGDQGQLEAAAGIMREVLEKRQQILGDEHPDTISAMSNLSIILSASKAGQSKIRSVKNVFTKVNRKLRQFRDSIQSPRH